MQLAPTSHGQCYSQFQIQTDTALSESTCSAGGSGCAVPAPNSPGAFYPYWTQMTSCTWGFGNVARGNTFGQDAQYGTDQFGTLGYDEFQGAIMNNTCRAL